jgi:ATP-dependent Clp protease ATP-binding subunit ClpX
MAIEREHHADANRRIYQELSELVIGHDNAKKVLINLVNRSKLRYYQKWGLMDRVELIKLSNCLLIGDSGTGKTHLVESLAKIMKFPLLKIDATDLNPTGASGGIKSEDLIKKIQRCAKDAMEDDPETYWSYDGTLDQVIVFVDEVDKLGQKLSSDWNNHVQSNFLAMFENKAGLDGISFIFAGAFTGMSRKAEQSKKLGFHHYADTSTKESDISQAVVKFGLIPEFVGRLNNIVLLDTLSKEDYVTILQNTILPKASKTLEYYGIQEYTLNIKEIDTIAEDAVKSGLGVRSLESSINKLLVELEFSPNSYEYKE